MNVAAAKALEIVGEFDGSNLDDADDDAHPLFQHQPAPKSPVAADGGGAAASKPVAAGTVADRVTLPAAAAAAAVGGGAAAAPTPSTALEPSSSSPSPAAAPPTTTITTTTATDRTPPPFDAAVESGSWSCSACTFLNTNLTGRFSGTACEMCGHAREAADAASAEEAASSTAAPAPPILSVDGAASSVEPEVEGGTGAEGLEDTVDEAAIAAGLHTAEYDPPQPPTPSPVSSTSPAAGTADAAPRLTPFPATTEPRTEPEDNQMKGTDPTPEPAPEPAPDPEGTVVLESSAGQTIGLKLTVNPTTGKGVAVKSVDEGGQADVTGKFQKGILITHINGIDVTAFENHQIGTMIKSSAQLKFLLADAPAVVPAGPTIASQIPNLLEEAKTDGKAAAGRDAVWNLFCSHEELVRSFIGPTPERDLWEVNLDLVRACYAAIEGSISKVDDLGTTLINAASFHLDNMASNPVPNTKMSATDWERQIVLVLENPILHEFDALEALLPKVTAALDKRVSATPTSPLDSYLTSLDAARFNRLVETFQQEMTLRILDEKEEDGFVLNFDEHFVRTVSVLKQLHTVNLKRETPVPSELFQNDAVNEHFAVSQRNQVRDYEVWRRETLRISHKLPAHALTVVDNDFLLTLAVKVKLLTIENLILREQNSDQRNPQFMMQAMFGGPQPKEFRITVNRSNLVRDAITQLSETYLEDPKIFIKEFRVEFADEEGLDYGGVRKEFFQLVLGDLFDAKYGMFTFSEESRMHWFQKNSFETPEEYRLLGMMMGIALYNNVNLDLSFPPVLYEKLMEGKTERHVPKLTLQDSLKRLADVDPGLAHGLSETLAYVGDDFSDIFDRTFAVDYEVFGEKRTDPLCEGGAEKVLTLENREEFVQLYIEYVLTVSVKRVFDAFREGFWRVADGSGSLKLLFDPLDLEFLICGTQDLDFEALQRITTYDGTVGSFLIRICVCFARGLCMGSTRLLLGLKPSTQV
jgi:ubiquitin-protein ligase E3 A